MYTKEPFAELDVMSDLLNNLNVIDRIKDNDRNVASVSIDNIPKAI